MKKKIILWCSIGFSIGLFTGNIIWKMNEQEVVDVLHEASTEMKQRAVEIKRCTATLKKAAVGLEKCVAGWRECRESQ